MSEDTIQPLQERITKIVGDEERLNRNRVTGMKTKKDRRDAEKRTETSNLATLEREKAQQMGANAEKERKFQEALRREGEELVDLSKGIRDDYIAEIRHREVAKEQLQTKITALEGKLRTIEGARPS
ncbi:MAG TPA: hypothetical protein DEB30_00660 [Candidatus Peribacter riflensis]|uniref:Uncharacterized protein n=1 Tax=Candidatus Peribacter riflensis TaxID=1735162 RepID=A0A0S1SDX9_9BACT|nr:MAG: hypothetical protein PeribacterA2_0292 [Candidatus Peribacter riflensis]OGJ78260.1 MAG: hypothetical protein A2398_05220 [Candidatus Peribacteria bacterium RIFOXYB1_FULL_57_12]OGJ83115.1 MAG: hypothetical protein A2412_01425 [Candidatus Peribacteria bacterium RIFOXYC1_FULL_58_8]ALM10786.1 MAG: hypothetical protein PeribacterB2_0292 [Candidatus Peribacter riflensis]ALM11888.1 MAG: hypothetical protein PeribacterC2_0291 [Candidatus Peribacter riflensis]